MIKRAHFNSQNHTWERERGSATEACVICKRDTHIKRDINIEKRTHYVEGVGQLCTACAKELKTHG